MSERPQVPLSALRTRTGPPEAWLPARRVTQALSGPIERFIQLEVAGAAMLLAATLLAVVWANSPWAESYERLWATELRLSLGPWSFGRTLHFWVNELLMTVFFLVAGYELKRELAQGALSQWRRAALPLAGALGAIVAPLAIYLALNAGRPGSHGWGIPTGMGLAFALAVLSVLGARVPPALRVLLLATAILNDLACMLLIAGFYSHGLDAAGLVPTGIGLAALVAMRKAGVRPGTVYLLPLIVLWSGLLVLGVHPTLAGMVAGLTMPVEAWYDRARFLRIAEGAIAHYRRVLDEGGDEEALLHSLDALVVAGREAVSPVVRALAHFHPLVVFGVVPVFALANAGIPLSTAPLAEPGAGWVVAGVVLGLVVGKPLGVLSATWLAVRLRVCCLPSGVTWTGMAVVGRATGIGFTLSILFAGLSFQSPALEGAARLAVLGASALAALAALALGRLGLRPPRPDLPELPLSAVESNPSLWLGDLNTLRELLARERAAAQGADGASTDDGPDEGVAP